MSATDTARGHLDTIDRLGIAGWGIDSAGTLSLHPRSKADAEQCARLIPGPWEIGSAEGIVWVRSYKTVVHLSDPAWLALFDIEATA